MIVDVLKTMRCMIIYFLSIYTYLPGDCPNRALLSAICAVTFEITPLMLKIKLDDIKSKSIPI